MWEGSYITAKDAHAARALMASACVCVPSGPGSGLQRVVFLCAGGVRCCPPVFSRTFFPEWAHSECCAAEPDRPNTTSVESARKFACLPRYKDSSEERRHKPAARAHNNAINMRDSCGTLHLAAAEPATGGFARRGSRLSRTVLDALATRGLRGCVKGHAQASGDLPQSCACRLWERRSAGDAACTHGGSPTQRRAGRLHGGWHVSRRRGHLHGRLHRSERPDA